GLLPPLPTPQPLLDRTSSAVRAFMRASAPVRFGIIEATKRIPNFMASPFAVFFFKQKTAYEILCQYNRAQVQLYQLLHELHFIVKWQFQLCEQLGHHFRSAVLMPMECPSNTFVKTLCCGLGNIVHDGRPTQPQVVRQ